MPKNKRLDLNPYFNLYEQLNNEPLPGEVRRFLNKFAEQAVVFQTWGRWDRRSGFDPIAYEQTLSHVETYLTGRLTHYTGAMPVFAERLARALTDCYVQGYESEAADTSEEAEPTMLIPPTRGNF